MPKVSMINSTVKNMSKDFTLYAQMNKSFAERLVFNNGIRGHLTSKALFYDLGVDIFDKTGSITKDGYETVMEIIKNNKLGGESTWLDAIKVSHTKWLKSKNPDKNTFSLFDYMINPL